ncbi:hypothetical protein EDB84DRAFT_600096 [Lactarius hengduanensis]|nr:hypothetical protein EDB84DRAFT_500549 [Lactarius hengduanensis]KAH9050321.1 hypothetical protein EDB84DRAFT_600096 [Lactarius hengduanensis]
MPLSLPSMNAAIVCDDVELETYDVKQEGTSSLTAFIASEAGKQFKVTYSNNLTDFELNICVYIDGQCLRAMCLRPGESSQFLGPYNSACSVLPLEFQELQLVDLEDVPVASETGMIELKGYRCRILGVTTVPLPPQSAHKGLHGGRVSELSKKAGWHHIATGNEIPIRPRLKKDILKIDYHDPRRGSPYASIKIFYRSRELLRAQGVIPGNDESMQGSPINNKKRAREDGSPGPPRSRQKFKRELSEDAREQRIRALQAELDTLRAAKQSGTVKRELRSPSPIIVRHAGEVVDLTLDD